MYKWIYSLSTNEWLYGGPTEPDYNPATQGCAKLSRHPRPRTERHDGAGGIRQATAQEIIDYDVALKDAQASSCFDSTEAAMIKALAIWTAQKLGIQPAVARSEILTIYRSL
jgi:hypothetical protein